MDIVIAQPKWTIDLSTLTFNDVEHLGWYLRLIGSSKRFGGYALFTFMTWASRFSDIDPLALDYENAILFTKDFVAEVEEHLHIIIATVRLDGYTSL